MSVTPFLHHSLIINPYEINIENKCKYFTFKQYYTTLLVSVIKMESIMKLSDTTIEHSQLLVNELEKLSSILNNVTFFHKDRSNITDMERCQFLIEMLNSFLTAAIKNKELASDTKVRIFEDLTLFLKARNADGFFYNVENPEQSDALKNSFLGILYKIFPFLKNTQVQQQLESSLSAVEKSVIELLNTEEFKSLSIVATAVRVEDETPMVEATLIIAPSAPPLKDNEVSVSNLENDPKTLLSEKLLTELNKLSDILKKVTFFEDNKEVFSDMDRCQYTILTLKNSLHLMMSNPDMMTEKRLYEDLNMVLKGLETNGRFFNIKNPEQSDALKNTFFGVFYRLFPFLKNGNVQKELESSLETVGKLASELLPPTKATLVIEPSAPPLKYNKQDFLLRPESSELQEEKKDRPRMG
jgi:hypothetical protein